jgi:hypothetical protein
MDDGHRLSRLERFLLHVFSEQEIRTHARRLELATKLPGQGTSHEELAIAFAALLSADEPRASSSEARLRSYASAMRALNEIARSADAQIRQVENRQGTPSFLPSSHVASALASAVSAYRDVEQDLRLREGVEVSRQLDRVNAFITGLEDTTEHHCDLQDDRGMDYDLLDDDMDALRSFVRDIRSCCQALEAEGRRLAGVSPSEPPGGER